MAIAAGTQLGPGEILSPLGARGRGEVYKARDIRLDREVAIKVLPAHLSQDPEALAHFKREAKGVAALSHPNILTICDIGTAQGLSVAVMELLGCQITSVKRDKAAIAAQAKRLGWRRQLTNAPLAVSLNECVNHYRANWRGERNYHRRTSQPVGLDPIRSLG